MGFCKMALAYLDAREARIAMKLCEQPGVRALKVQLLDATRCACSYSPFQCK